MFNIASGLIGKYSELFWAGAILLFGATTHATIALKHARDHSLPYNCFDFMIAMLIASFSGMFFGLAMSAIGWTDKHLYLAIGLGAFLGLKGMNQIAQVLIKVVTEKTGK